MKCLRSLPFLWLVLLTGACGDPGTVRGARTLRVNGSTTVAPIAVEVAEQLRERLERSIVVDTQGGSSGGLAMLGEGQVEIAMSSKPVADADRKKFPDVDFVEHRVGLDAVALVVSADVWEAGVRSISRAQMRDVYEGRITRWSELGGPDRRIAFFNKEPGRGTWSVFARWLYGDAAAAPAVSFPEVGGNEETRNKVAATKGALSQLSASWADGARVHALAIVVEGESVAPTSADVSTGRYPMSRALFLVTDGPPSGDARTFVEVSTGPEGRALVRKHGYLAPDDLGS